MKVGDKVKIVATDYMSQELANGHTGKIVAESPVDESCFAVQLDNGYAPPQEYYLDGLPAWAFHDHQLELVND